MSIGIGLADLAKLFEDTFGALSAHNSSAGTSLSVALDTGVYGRPVVEIWVKSSGAADFGVYGSRNGNDWRLVDTISLAVAGEEHRGYQNSYRHIKVETTAVNNNEIEISAMR